MSTDIEHTLRSAYLDAGGTEADFEASKDDLVRQYRHQATVNAAIEQANRKPDMNETLRSMAKEQRERAIHRAFPAAQESDDMPPPPRHAGGSGDGGKGSEAPVTTDSNAALNEAFRKAADYARVQRGS